jgi:hypothetical protein
MTVASLATAGGSGVLHIPWRSPSFRIRDHGERGLHPLGRLTILFVEYVFLNILRRGHLSRHLPSAAPSGVAPLANCPPWLG